MRKMFGAVDLTRHLLFLLLFFPHAQKALAILLHK